MERSKLTAMVSESNALAALYALLFGTGEMPVAGDAKTAEGIVVAACRAIRDDDKALFGCCLDALSGRSPSEESTWIYNDLLFFVMVAGAFKFNCDNSFLARCLGLRHRRTEKNEEMITNSLLRICGDSLEYTSPYGFMDLTVANLRGDMSVTQEQLNCVYRDVKQVSADGQITPFCRMVVTRAEDLLFELKELDDPVAAGARRQFLSAFQCRTKLIGQICHDLIVFAYLLAGLFVLYPELLPFAQAKELAKQVDGVLGLLGIGGLVGVILLRKSVVRFCEIITNCVWGLPRRFW